MRTLRAWELEAFINRTLEALGEEFNDGFGLGDYIPTPEIDRGAAALVMFEYLTR
jgi:hypothetical protein